TCHGCKSFAVVSGEWWAVSGQHHSPLTTHYSLGFGGGDAAYLAEGDAFAAADDQLHGAVVNDDASDDALGRQRRAGPLVGDGLADQVGSLAQLLERQHLREAGVQVLNAFQARELRELGGEVGAVERIEWILIPHLRGEELEEVILAEQIARIRRGCGRC